MSKDKKIIGYIFSYSTSFLILQAHFSKIHLYAVTCNFNSSLELNLKKKQKISNLDDKLTDGSIRIVICYF